MQLTLDPNSIDSYRTFLAVKQLPIYSIRGRVAEFPDEYAGFVFDDDSEPAGRLCYIYALIDPRTGEVRYIGKSHRPCERLANHLNDRSICHRTNWLRSLVAAGLKPTLKILAEAYPSSSWQAAERAWIQYAREQGWPLTNGTDGGDGVPGLSPETRERIVAASRGRKPSPETRARIGKASKGRKHTEAYKQFMRQRMSVRVFTEEHRQRISDSSRRFSDEEAEQIRNRITAGETAKAVATDLGVSRRVVFEVKHRKGAYGR